MHLHLLPYEWHEGPGIPGPHWRPPGSGGRGHLDLRTKEQRRTRGGEGGFGLFAFDEQRPATGGLYLGESLDARLTNKQRADVAAMLAIGETPTANLTELLCHLFTQYSDPLGVTSRKPVRANSKLRVRLTVAGREILNQPFAGAHVTRSVAVFRRDYERAVASIPKRLGLLDAQRRRNGEPDLTSEERAEKVRQFRIEMQRWAGNETRRHFGRLTPENARALLPDGNKNDGARDPTTVVNETWPTPDTSTLSTGQDQPWDKESGDWATDQDPIGGGSGGPFFTSVKVDTSSAYSMLRCQTPVSSDDMYHESQQTYFLEPDDNKLPGTGIRVDAVDDTGVFVTRYKESGTVIYMIQREEGTNTFDGGTPSTDPGHSDEENDRRYRLRIEGDGSQYSAYLDDDPVFEDVTDTQISGNLLGGLLGYDNVTRAFGWLSHEIGDLLAGPSFQAAWARNANQILQPGL